MLIFLGVFYLDSLQIVSGALFFNIAMAIVSFLMSHEFYKALESKGFKPLKGLGYMCTLFLIPVGVVKSGMLGMICASLVPIIIIVGMTVSVVSRLKYNVSDIAVTLFGAMYTVLMVAFLSATRAMELGVFLIFYSICGAWLSDTFAFLIGKAIGKHKFSKLSPKKSIEGCIGGVIGSVLFFVVYSIILSHMDFSKFETFEVLKNSLFTNYPLLILLGIIVSVISQIGDLAASGIKRYVDIKDFSHLMPGHGGMLDRFDSVLFVAPIMYYVFFIILHV